MSLTVKLDIYEGPLDLLLHLIRKNEVDIYDIPIALITGQYLEYLDLMETMNIEVAGEFLLMAATLLQIKSRLLIPELNESAAEEEEDPRMAIVRPLLEHMKIKEAAEVLERRTLLNRDVFTRPTEVEYREYAGDNDDYIEASLFDLVDAFRSLVKQVEVSTGLRIVVETKSIQERIREILARLRRSRNLTFFELCRDDISKAEVILSFLAILELARIGCLKIFQHAATHMVSLFLVEPVASQHGRSDRRSGENESSPESWDEETVS